MLILVRLINHPRITSLIGTGDRILAVARAVKYTASSSLGKRVHFGVQGEKRRRAFSTSHDKLCEYGV